MADAPLLPIRCTFHVRAQVSDAPTFRYDTIHLDSLDAAGHLATTYPPLKHDLIHLRDMNTGTFGTYRVIDRAWHHPARGSHDWPHGDRYPNDGPLLDIIVELTEGPFVDEAELDGEATRG